MEIERLYAMNRDKEKKCFCCYMYCGFGKKLIRVGKFKLGWWGCLLLLHWSIVVVEYSILYYFTLFKFSLVSRVIGSREPLYHFHVHATPHLIIANPLHRLDIWSCFQYHHLTFIMLLFVVEREMLDITTGTNWKRNAGY